jgi:fatty acid desaturase
MVLRFQIFNLYLYINNYNHFTFLKVFEIDDVKAWKTVLISATSYALGLLMISKAPWYLLPLAWAWTGTAVTGVSSTYTFLMIILYWSQQIFSS